MKRPPRIYHADPTPVLVTRYIGVTEIRIKISRNGQRRATYFSAPLFRWMPMPIDIADMMIATGQATQID